MNIVSAAAERPEPTVEAPPVEAERVAELETLVVDLTEQVKALEGAKR